jgi:hypothetical protein
MLQPTISTSHITSPSSDAKRLSAKLIKYFGSSENLRFHYLIFQLSKKSLKDIHKVFVFVGSYCCKENYIIGLA